MLILFTNQFLFGTVGYTLASIIGTLNCLFGGYKIIDFALFVVPYKFVKVKEYSLYQVMTSIVIVVSLYAFIDHQQFNNLSSMPKWMYIVLHVFYLGASISLSKIVKLHIYLDEYIDNI